MSTGPDRPFNASAQDDLPALEPWRPTGIELLLEPDSSRDDPRWNELRHVVIDELEEKIVGLVVSSWPRVDERGRLRFGGEHASERIATVADALRAVLEEERVVAIDDDPYVRDALQRRELVVGDVFAAFLASPPGGGGGDGDDGGGGGPGTTTPEGLFRRPVLDITAEARDAAKAQASATASGVIDEAFLELVSQEFRADEEPPPTAPETPPVPRGSDSSGGAAEEPGAASEKSARAGETAGGASPAEVEKLRRALGGDSEEKTSESRREKPMPMGA